MADQRTALLAQCEDGHAHGLATTQALVLQLSGAYIRQSLALAMLGNDLAGQFDGLLSQQARQLFAQLYPDEDFLAHIQGLGRP